MRRNYTGGVSHFSSEECDEKRASVNGVALPNGFALGLQIEPASPEKNKEIAKKLAGYPPVESGQRNWRAWYRTQTHQTQMRQYEFVSG
jgi:hypothetical protein